MKSLLLPPLSALYGAVTRTRLSLYQRGTFHTTKLDRPVISRLVPGDGALPLAPMLTLLQRSGYAGPYELELIGPAIDEEGARDAVARSIAHLTTLSPGEL